MFQTSQGMSQISFYTRIERYVQWASSQAFAVVFEWNLICLLVYWTLFWQSLQLFKIYNQLFEISFLNDTILCKTNIASYTIAYRISSYYNVASSSWLSASIAHHMFATILHNQAFHPSNVLFVIHWISPLWR